MDRLPTPVSLDFLGGSAGKESACNAEDLGLIPGLGRAPGEGNGYLLQYSGLENSIDCIESLSLSIICNVFSNILDLLVLLITRKVISEQVCGFIHFSM